MSKRKKVDAYLAEVYNQFIAIKDNDYKRSLEVFKCVFDVVKQKMGEQCNFFSQYSSQVMYAGSVYDGIKVSQMDEFDMDIVIRLPISYEDGPNGISIENDQPGFVRLKIQNAFDNLDKQQNWENRHKVTRDWRDPDKYFLQNKFRFWLQSLLQKALNDLGGKVDVNGTFYLVTYKEAGPAYTLNITNDKDNEPFLLDVDLVPVIRMLHPRWPEGYRSVSGSQAKEWLIVPKPNKAVSGSAQRRCWRLSFQEFEREMMKGCEQMKTCIRLVKKLRDGLKLKIASYYIKTLFLWELEKDKDKSYWRNKISVTFRGMVEKLHDALKVKNIKYFWHEDNNLVEALKPTLAKLYAEKLKEVLDAIDADDADKVVSYLLSAEDMKKFKESEFYQKNSAAITSQVSLSKQSSVSSSQSDSPGPIAAEVKALNDELDSCKNASQMCPQKKLLELELRVKRVEDRLADYEDRLRRLEMAMRVSENRENGANGCSQQ